MALYRWFGKKHAQDDDHDDDDDNENRVGDGAFIKFVRITMIF